MKKCISIILCLAMIFCFSVSSFAAEKKQANTIWDERDNDIISLIKATPENGLDKALEEYSNSILSDQNKQKLYTDRAINQSSSNPTIYKTVTVSKDVGVSFYTDGTFAISVLKSKPKSINATVVKSNSVNYKDYSYTRTWYGLFSTKLFDITCSGDYAYDGASAWDAGNSESDYTFGDFSFGTVSGWDSGVITYQGTSCEVYGRGTFGGGFTYNGNSYQFAQKYYEVYLTCTKNGSISARYTK